MRKIISATAVAALATAIVLPVFAATPQTTTETTSTTTVPVTTTTTVTTTDPVTTTTTPTTTTPTTTNSITTPNPAGPRTPRPRTHWFAGTVMQVGGSSLTVGVLWTGPFDGSLNGQQTTVTVNPGTPITGPGGSTVQLQSIPSGDLVGVRATGLGSDLTTLSADQIRVYCNCHWIGGTISQTPTGSSVSVQVARTGPFDTVLNGQTVTVQLNGSTQYLEGPQKNPISSDDLKQGEKVGIVFSANGFFKAPGFNPATATFTASRVHVWPGRQVPLVSSDGSATAGTGY